MLFCKCLFSIMVFWSFFCEHLFWIRVFWLFILSFFLGVELRHFDHVPLQMFLFRLAYYGNALNCKFQWIRVIDKFFLFAKCQLIRVIDIKPFTIDDDIAFMFYIFLFSPSFFSFSYYQLTWLLPHCVVEIVRLGFVQVVNEIFCLSSCKSWLESWPPCNWLYESRKSLYFGLVICCRNTIPCVQGSNLSIFMGLALTSVFGIV